MMGEVIKNNKPQINWLNRNILTMGLTGFFSDFGHEMATSILPSLITCLGSPAALLGLDICIFELDDITTHQKLLSTSDDR